MQSSPELQYTVILSSVLVCFFFIILVYVCPDPADGDPAFLGTVRAVVCGGGRCFTHSAGGAHFLQIYPASSPSPAEIQILAPHQSGERVPP